MTAHSQSTSVELAAMRVTTFSCTGRLDERSGATPPWVVALLPHRKTTRIGMLVVMRTRGGSLAPARGAHSRSSNPVAPNGYARTP